jgi:hypothetical protein
LIIKSFIVKDSAALRVNHSFEKLAQRQTIYLGCKKTLVLFFCRALLAAL